MIESREPKEITSLQKEKPPKTEEVFDKPRFEAELQRIKSFPWPWQDGEPSKEETKAAIQDIIQDANVLAEALHIQDAFYDSLEALNTLVLINEGESRVTAISILEGSMPTIEGYIRSDKIFFNHECLTAAKNLVNYGNGEQQKLGIKVFSDHADALAFSIKTDRSFLYTSFIETMVKRGDPKSAQEALLILQDSILLGKASEIRDYGLLGWGFVSGEAKIREVADSIVKKKLFPYGLNVERVFDAWRASLPPRIFDFSEAIGRNIMAIETLEAQRPGIVNFLSKRFGIYDFGRYPAEMLLWQFDNYDNDELPYGVVFYPKNDHNGAFYENIEVFRQLFEQLKGKFEIRVGEAESKLDLVKLLHRLNRKYGEKHKISFAIIGGHGTWTSIQFGGEEEKHSLKAWDLWDEKHPVSKKKRYFEDEPTFILVSCSTGAEHGIAEVLSKEMQAIIIAPTEPTGLKSIKVEIKNKKPVFSVKYSEEGFTKTYTPKNTPKKIPLDKGFNKNIIENRI